MLANSPLTGVKASSYVDYTKMTNGFVFGGIGVGIDGNGRDGARPSKGMDWDTAARFTLTLRQVAVYEGGSVSGREFTL
jgi:hypothetical protein